MYTVKKQNDAVFNGNKAVSFPHWAVYLNGKLIEGGFFTEAAAEFCAEKWNAELTTLNCK